MLRKLQKRLDGLYSSTSSTNDAAELNELCLVSPRFGRIVSAECVRVREQKKNLWYRKVSHFNCL